MPKGNAATRRLRQEIKQLKELAAQFEPSRAVREQSRVPVRRPVTFDWNCQCGYYCYNDKGRCPICKASKGLGCLVRGYQRRIPVATQAPPPPTHSRHAAGQPLQQQTQQHNQQRQAPQPQQQPRQQPALVPLRPGPQSRMQAQTQAQVSKPLATRQTAVSYAEAAKIGLQEKSMHGARKEGVASSGLQGGAASAGQSAEAHCTAPLAAVLPAGPEAATAKVAAPPTDNHDISSDAEYFRWDEYDEPETIGELDPHSTDPSRILNRMRGITRAIKRRRGRLQKAQQDCELQRQVVEQAKELLLEKEAAVKTTESDIHYLQEVHTDLAKKYTSLTEEEEQQGRQSQQLEEQQCKIQSTQQAIWQMAVTLRGLGVDPRIDSALLSLESLFRSAQGESEPPQQPVGEVARLPGAQPALQPTQPTQPSTPTPPSVSTPAPATIPAAPIICTKCWSVACRCGFSHAARGHREENMEVDQERGAKRTCRDAELPEGAPPVHSSPSALPVDAEGKAAAPQDSGSTEAAQGCAHTSAGGEVREQPGAPVEGAQPEALPSESASLPHGSASAPQPATHPGESAAPSEPTNEAEAAGLPESYAKSDKVGDEVSREASKASFANLVKTCTQRSHPY